MSDITFAKGIKVKEIGNFGNIRLSINSGEIFNQQNGFDEKTGWGNFIIAKSKNGNLYVKVDTWKPNQEKEVVNLGTIDEDEIPF